MCSPGAERAMLPTTDGTSIGAPDEDLTHDDEPSFE
jgi:hypothetical protein